MDNGELKRSLQSDATHAFVVGNIVKVNALSADGKAFIFTRDQMEFFLALQKLKSIQPAALSIHKDEEWAKRFLSSKKFKAFLSAKMQELQLKSGITIDWWFRFGKHLTEGVEEFYAGTCLICQKDSVFTTYEAESFRDDDMVMKATCPECNEPMQITQQTKEFKATREQVEGWKELGSRIIPKIERVSHEFDKTEMVFETRSD